MKFLKENSYDIFKLFINQVGIAIFSLFLYTAVGSLNIEDSTKLLIKVLISIFATLFYCVLLYTATWDIGAKDRIRIDAGRLECKKSKGLLMGLYANVVNFLFAGICAISSYVYMLSDGALAVTMTQIFNVITRFIMSVYLGLVQGAFSAFSHDAALSFFLQSIGFFICPVIAIIATHFGYRMGLSENCIFSKSPEKNK